MQTYVIEARLTTFLTAEVDANSLEEAYEIAGKMTVDDFNQDLNDYDFEVDNIFTETDSEV